MIGSTLKTLGFTSAALVAATFAVLAQTAPPAPQPDVGAADGRGDRPMAACRADMKALCGNIERGGARMQCLVDNKAKASPECQSAMAAIQQQMAQRGGRHGGRQAREACRADAQSLCGAVEPGRGGMMRCLRENAAKVSPACSQALASLPMRRRGQMEPATGLGGLPVAPQPAPNAPNTPKPQ
jgi:Cysteine rich repeat